MALNASAQLDHARSASSNRPSPPCRTISRANCSTPMKSRWMQRHASRTHGRKRSPNSASVKSKDTDNDPKVGGTPIGRREPAVAIVLAMRASPSTTRMRISPESTPRRCHTKLRHFDQRPTRLLWTRTDLALTPRSALTSGHLRPSSCPSSETVRIRRGCSLAREDGAATKSAEGYAGRSFVVVNLRGDCSGNLEVRYRQNIGRRRIPRDSRPRAGLGSASCEEDVLSLRRIGKRGLSHLAYSGRAVANLHLLIRRIGRLRA
jgi:hypothetical protein